MTITHVVSMSGGKDSTATAILALEQHGVEVCQFVFADTGNEHATTYEYALDYLPSALGIRVDVVRADFADEFATKRTNLARLAAGEPESAVYGRRQFQYQWTPAAAARALELLHPTGNPYLDMCMLKGGFPSRKRQYCTDYLKTQPLTSYALDLLDTGHAVWSWQGVRIDESLSRRERLQGTGACVKAFEEVGGGLYNYRPILRWTTRDVFQAHELAGIQPNPLYLQGMSRVGCMPCINCSKGELREIARRFPDQVERVAEWERLVSATARQQSATFFTSDRRGYGIHKVVEWSRTTRGGRQFSLLEQIEETGGCSSAYGLCE